MREHKAKSIEEIVDRLDSKRKELTGKLRSLVKKVFPQVVETVKWGNITYLLEGKNLAWIVIYEKHVDFGFFNGAELDSPLLEGTGKKMRHIKIESATDVNETKISRLLRKASTLMKKE